MKTQALLTLPLALAPPVSAFAAGEARPRHEHKPLHGGLVVEVKDIDYELVAKPDRDPAAPARSRQTLQMWPRPAPSSRC
jgi:hypothetical protein